MKYKTAVIPAKVTKGNVPRSKPFFWAEPGIQC